MNKINHFLKRDTIQRRSYFILLICWIIIFLNTDARVLVTSNTNYLPLIFIVPVLLLVLQMLFNNKILWLIILTCIGIYTCWTAIKLVTYIAVDRHRDYVETVEWNAATITPLLLIVLMFIALSLFVYKIKPVEKVIN